MAEKKKTYLVLADKLIECYLGGNLKPGERLPSERELAVQFNVSRTTIREALRTLELNGLIDIRQGGGSYVKVSDIQSNKEEIITVVKAENPLVFEMLELRRALEAESSFLAANRATPADLEKLRIALHNMALSKQDPELGLKADLDFHIGIAEATHNSIFIELIHTLKGHMEETIRATQNHRFKDLSRYGDTINEHREIYLAIASGNGDKAKELMEGHITKIRAELVESMI
ncbi:GntR family transcriptional regulator [Cytobacillus firmus]|uniref:FadR/GntR family transcriptional regulator n=1 Tax=Cytobacillus firmus TaxID=1399 RepID=UPI00077C392E|nr:FadR/GntR family transcriptional regulator [Cytobacillus firmus]MBG9542006.1 GntR family transcriptional regulator [Cytobacillus firmus]MBG9551680.1 GntR family transcriptional regulator [Cytobacillus firmus]MBG9556255.1 GntR family transcriptional regulator [Cytobacillus firmus]MBG9576096.1 GntR family transcriptional regulator [Cytobacillus firmus]MEC1895206.1 FadR/GntR family transcriptional regulator [Cytobacillus firmus]